MPDRAHTAPSIILAFDFGTRRIGIASGDTLTRTARPLATLDVKPTMPWPAIDKLIAELTPGQIVVGLPCNMDGTPTQLAAATRRFGAELKARYGLTVALVDERLSSREAASALRAARQSGLKRRRATHADVDQVAAKILLERWFDNPGDAESL